jgi:hypothetical protein
MPRNCELTVEDRPGSKRAERRRRDADAAGSCYGERGDGMGDGIVPQKQ